MVESFQHIAFVLQGGLVFLEFGDVLFEQLHGQMASRRLLNALPNLAAAAGGNAHDEFVDAVNQFVVGHDEILKGSPEVVSKLKALHDGKQMFR